MLTSSPTRQLDSTGLEEAFYQLYREFFDQAERKRRWSIRDDIPWHQVNAALPCAIANVVECFCAVELYLPDYISKALALPLIRASRGRAWFHANWGYEEAKHSLALGDWLVRSGHRTDAQMADLEGKVFDHEWNLPRDNPLGMILYGMVQEMATWLNYKNLRQRVDEFGDPALSRILGYIGVDERCHYEFYKRIALMYLERDRQGTLEELRRVLQTFAMPALHMLADSRQREAEVKSLDIFSEEIFFRDVLQPLLGALDVAWSELRQRDPQRKSWPNRGRAVPA
jgi:acyl-[acyl-carrier-protein] desaturase